MIRSDFLEAGDHFADGLVAAASRQRGKVIVDGGAARGTYTEKLLKAGCRELIYCFEPFPRNNELFHQRLGFPRNVVLMPFALYDRRQSVSFAVQKTVATAGPMQGYSSLGFIDNNNGLDDPEMRLDVEAVRLDEVVAYPVSLLKLDLQGGEQRALRGAERLFEQGLIDAVYFEFSGDRSCISLMERHGFQLFCTALAAIGDFKDVDLDARILGVSRTTTNLKLTFYAHNYGDMPSNDFVSLLHDFRTRHGYIQTDIIAIHPDRLGEYLPPSG